MCLLPHGIAVALPAESCQIYVWQLADWHVVISSESARCQQASSPLCMQGHALAPRYPAGCRVLYDAFDQEQPVQGTVAKVDWQGASCTSAHTLLEWQRVQHRLRAASPSSFESRSATQTAVKRVVSLGTVRRIGPKVIVSSAHRFGARTLTQVIAH